MLPQLEMHGMITFPYGSLGKVLGQALSQQLDGLTPLGWIVTETAASISSATGEKLTSVSGDKLFPSEALTYCKLTNSLAFEGVTVTCTFTPGSCSLNGFRLTETGNSWGRAATKQPLDKVLKLYEKYNETHYEKIPLVLSDNYLGYFLTPNEWNYNLMPLKFSNTLVYNLSISNPIKFFHQNHRPLHFLNFTQIQEDQADDSETNDQANLLS